MVRRYRFRQVDVFTDRPLHGNPLAVFSEADGLSDDEMQALAVGSAEPSSARAAPSANRLPPIVNATAAIELRID